MSLARALINDGTLAYLDEPTEGLDKEGKKAVLDIIKRLKVQKKTILIASNDQEIIDLAQKDLEELKEEIKTLKK